ncbi:MAG: CDP-alcohol phosphatidyltransferase family protein [Candidatus Lokiarchaeota archaeon]|nr:CDP-alcohol phosphatidyltransferase family protein [Candidatus Lokiarchaeota archaeon]
MVMEKLRHISNRVIEPIAKRFIGSRVSPNIITILGLVAMAVASACAAIVGYLGLHPAFLCFTVGFIFLSGFFDLLDGGVAKFTGQKTKFGGVLDSTCDRYSDALFIIGLISGNYLNPPYYVPLPNPAAWGVVLGFLGIIGAFMTSYIRSRAEIEGVKMAGVGWIERGERMSVFFLGTIAEILASANGVYGVMFWVFLVLTVLMHVTSLQRVRHAQAQLKLVDLADAARPDPPATAGA